MKQKLQSLQPWLFWVCCGVLVLMGLFFRFAVVGYSFSALICFCLLALLLCYKGLSLLAKHHQKTAKVLRIILNICVCIGLCIVLVTGFIVVKASFGQADTVCDYVVVLGAGVHGTTPSFSLRNRLDAAYDFLVKNPDVVCIVSGGKGQGEQITEAQCMYDDLVSKGIDPGRIWQEDKATSTEENLQFSLDLIEARTGQRPTQINLLSSEYHLYRAGLFAKAQGVTAYGVPAQTTKFVLRVNYFLREIAGVWHEILIGG